MRHGFNLGPGEITFGHSTDSTDYLVRALFSGTRTGSIYDLTRLDSMATTVFSPRLGAAVANGAVIGLVLDGRYNYQAGTPLPVNETFAGGTNWEIFNANPTTIITYLNPGVRFVSGTIDPPVTILRASNIALVPNQWYEITLNITAINGPGQIRVGASYGSTVSNILGPQRVLWKAQSQYLEILRTTANVDLTIASFSCRPLPGNHLDQTNTTKRPTLVMEGGRVGLSFVSTVPNFLTSSNTALGWNLPIDRVSGFNLGANTANQHMYGCLENKQVLWAGTELSRYMQGDAESYASLTMASAIKGAPTIICDRVNSSRVYLSQTGKTPVTGTNVRSKVQDLLIVGASPSGSAPTDCVWYGGITVASGPELTDAELDLCIRWMSRRTGVRA